MLIKISLIFCVYLTPGFAKEVTLSTNEGRRFQIHLGESYQWLSGDKIKNQIPAVLDPFFEIELVAIERILALTGQVHFRVRTLPISVLRDPEYIVYVAIEMADYINQTIELSRRLISVQNRIAMMTLVLDFLSDQFEIIDRPLVKPLTNGFIANYHASQTDKYVRRKFWASLSKSLGFIDPKIFKSNRSDKFVLMLRQIYNPYGLFFGKPSGCQLQLSLKP